MYTIVNFRRKRHQKMISSPIAMLPPELMRSVIPFVVGPSERHAILQLSHVSRSFQQTVLDMSWLFTEAHWDRWPTPLLDLWCQRARAQPLTVSLSDETIHWLTVDKAPELKALLELYSRRWGTLVLRFHIEAYGEETIRFVERLLQCACPLLRTISSKGTAGSRITLHLHPDCLPSLQTLCLRRIWPVFSTSPTSVTELTCSCTREGDWLPLLDAVKGCRLIQRLVINSSGYCGEDPITFPAATGKAVLSSLTHLEIEGIGTNLALAISQFLGHCDIPKLESLTVRSGWCTHGVFHDLWQSVVRP